MKLVIGGAFQGKRRVAQERYSLTQRQCMGGEELAEMLFSKEALPEELSCITELHLLIRALMQEGRAPEPVLEELLERYPDLVLVCDELGSGLVPMDAFSRKYRESCGRILCRLAAQAEEVVRVLCGLATVIASREREERRLAGEAQSAGEEKG